MITKATDLRVVRRNQSYFIGNNICNSCGRLAECKFFKPAQRCETYLPTLKFRNLDGLENHAFNTFRSSAWSYLLLPDSIVSLVNSSGFAEICRAKVTKIFVDDRDSAEKIHGPANHLYSNKKFDLEGFRLLRKKNSGPRIYESMKRVSVIYLEKV
jgi:hypothetical protein